MHSLALCIASTSPSLLHLNSTNQTTTLPRSAWRPLIGGALCVLLYLLAAFFTGSYFMGDTVDYAQAIVAHAAGRDYFFWEFGHLLWRPLGFALFQIAAPITRAFVG